jgi:hypothetical protein
LRPAAAARKESPRRGCAQAGDHHAPHVGRRERTSGSGNHLSRRPLDDRPSVTKITPYTQTNPNVLMKRVRRAGEIGYTVITNETVMGDIAVAAAMRAA